jgi:hypothetical protein
MMNAVHNDSEDMTCGQDDEDHPPPADYLRNNPNQRLRD